MVVKTVKVSQKSRRGFWFFIILIVVFSFIGFKTYRWVKQSLWDGQNRFNLVVNPSGDAAVLIVSFNPTEKKVNALVIPTGTFIETIHGYGPYRIEAIYNLGELNGQGGQLLSGSLQYYLGLPIDGFIAQQNSFLKNGREGLHLFVLDQFYGALKGKGKTNLSRWDLLRLWWFFRNVRSDKVNLVDLGQTSASELIDLPDGTQARQIEPERLSRIMSQLFLDEGFKKEGLSIAVLNKTEHPGLASSVARLITNIGGQVINIGQKGLVGEVKNEGCELRSKGEVKNSYPLRKLEQVFSCQWTGEEKEDQRAAVVLIVGDDYWRRLNFP